MKMIVLSYNQQKVYVVYIFIYCSDIISNFLIYLRETSEDKIINPSI